jgi:uncharacterized protein (TIGR02722 family)
MGRKLRIAAYVALSFVIMGCNGGTKVARVQSDSTIDLSGRWNDTDSRLVADEMIKDALNQRWIYKWEEEKRMPTVIVGKVTNKSHEHISVEAFVKDIERALLNSGRVSFVASRAEREQIRDEREDQQTYTSAETRSDMGEETGADLMMTGTINAIVDREGRRSVIFYQVNMELINLESTTKVWIGEKKIKKYVEKASARI